MGLLTTLAASVGLFRPPTDSATPVLFRSYRASAGLTSGHAPRTALTPSADGLAQLKARRLALLAEAEKQKNLRRSKAASDCERELRDVTTRILSYGKNFPGDFPC